MWCFSKRQILKTLLMSSRLPETGRTAPLEQGTTQQMGGKSCLLYDSAVVINDHRILLGEKDDMEANTTLCY